MSCHAHNSTEALSPYTFDRGDDPTETYTHQQQFAQRLRGVLGRINARLREAIVTDDLFGLRSEALVDDVPGDVFNFPTRESRVRGFLRWLRTQLDDEFLEVVGPDRNQFLRAAYIAGLRNAHTQLDELDVSFVRDADQLLSRPIHRAALQELYTRAYENLVSVRDDVAQGVRDELVAGFAEGEAPSKIASRLTDRVNSIGKHRATMIARSETINAHSTSTLTRAKELNRDVDDEIAAAHGEWNAADDSRTCAFCRALDGTPFRITEMENTTVTVTSEIGENFLGRTFRLKPPAHVQGRCNISLLVGGEVTGGIDDRLPDAISV